jgi:predicted methyltransferase
MTQNLERLSWGALLVLLAACSAPSKPHGSHGLHKDFSDTTRYSESFDDPARDSWQRPDEVVEHLRVPRGTLVVDLGAGTGYFLRRLSEATGPGGKVLALDVEPNMVSFMQDRMQKQSLQNVEPRLVAADDPGLSPDSVSRILIVNPWHHIDARSAYAEKLSRALEPTGEVLVVDFTLEAEHGPPARHRLAPEQVVSELEAGGLVAEIVQPESLPDQYLVRARRRSAETSAR